MSPLTPPASSTSSPKQHRLFSREHQIHRARHLLTAPRLQMSCLLVLTGGAGFLTSYALLQGGVDSMALRYPIAVGVGYLVFFALLRIWLWLQRNPLRDFADALEASVDGLGEASGGISRAGHGGGGGPGPKGSGWDFDLPGLDLGDGESLVFLAVVAVVGVLGLGVVVYTLYLAPLLLAEVLVDGVLLVGLYRRLRGPEPTHWAVGAVKRTWIPAAIVAVTFLFAGLIFQKLAPDARSIGGVWRSVSSDSLPAGSP